MRVDRMKPQPDIDKYGDPKEDAWWNARWNETNGSIPTSDSKWTERRWRDVDTEKKG